MSLQHIQPSGLFDSQPFGYSQVVRAPAGTTLYLSGQGAFDGEFQIVGGDDVAAQTRQALANVATALAGAGASVSDLVSLRIYVVDYQPEHVSAVGAALGEFFGETPPPAQTLIGVTALGLPGMRVEIEATAALTE